ncbi:MAG: hypothetical protein OEM32_10165 [Acidimicrobiia bacterium]|nr:hypothetical protein [Acidimicrobiia bacterium]
MPKQFTNTGLPTTGGGFDPLGLEGDCPGLFNVKIAGVCVDLGSAAPGGDPMITGQTNGNGAAPTYADGFGDAIVGRYGLGLIPRVEVRPVRSCPAGMVLGRDGVCYERKSLRAHEREWKPGVKPLLTGGERNAIAIAKRAAGKLNTAKKSLKKVAKAFDKAC